MRRFALDGIPKYKELPAAVRRAILFYWGSMSRAREKLALPSPAAPRQRWNEKLVVAEIRRLHAAGQHLSMSSLIDAGHNDLLVAASTYAGGWTRARRLAGVPFERRRSVQKQTWDAAAVITEIRSRKRSGEPLAVSKAPRPLVNAANRIFGSWRNAIEAAGIDYRQILLRGSFSDEEVLRWLRELAREKPSLTLWELDQHGEHALLCRRRWGTYEKAARAAGIRNWPVRERWPSMSRDDLLNELRSRTQKKRATAIGAVRRAPGGHRLIASALRYFKTWDDALRAAAKLGLSHR